MIVTRELLANIAAAASVLTVLLAAPLLLGAYVVTQRGGALSQFVWLSAVLVLLAGALLLGLAGLFLLG